MNSPTELLAQGFSLVTASNRLARHLRYRHAREQLDTGRGSWESPGILPWGAWLQCLWESYAFHHPDELLLNGVQEQALWQQLISRSSFARRLWSPYPVAKRAMDAWTLLHQYRIPIFPEGLYLNEDVYAFKSWAEAFQQRCREQGWIDNASFIDMLITEIGTGQELPNRRIALFGFDQFNPQQDALIKAMRSAGVEIVTAASALKNRTIGIIGYPDQHAEIKAAANWARGKLEDDPHGSIGIVVDGLHRLRDEIASGFEDVLVPGNLVNGTGMAGSPFSLSLGRALLDYSPVNTAMAILALGSGDNTVNEFGRLLNTPFIKGAETEKFKRARLDACLREHGGVRLDIDTLCHVAENRLKEGDRPTGFLACLKQLQAYLQQLPGKQSADEWAGHIAAILKLFGWPGERVLGTAEYQAVRAWQEVTARFVSLQMVFPHFGYPAVVGALRRIAAEFSFQPESRETPIQIMGMAGAAHMAFDHLWVMGLHEEAWPPAPQSNPFIPMVLQRQYQLPYGTAESALDHGRRTLTDLVNAVPEVVLSYPLNEQERPLRPAPLLNEFPASGANPGIDTVEEYPGQIFASRELEFIIDNEGPAIEAQQHISGGTALFKDQAACPFRAFARHRLHGRALADVDIGLNAMDRGLIIHRVMQLLWQRLRTWKRLIEIDDGELSSIIAAVAGDVIAGHRRQHPLIYTDRFTRLEQVRLETTVREWLEQERQRNEFSVRACELERRFIFAEIEVHTRIDRIDQLPDGREVIIDYKTGEVSVQQWFDRRPDEPQLPLYAVTSDTDIAGISFAKLKRGEMGYVGLAEDDGILPRTKAYAESRYAGDADTWQALLSHWRSTLTDLATAFRQGRAEVDPKDESCCRYCDQHLFCRIGELQATNDDPEGVLAEDE